MQKQVGDEDFAIWQWHGKKITTMPHGTCRPVFRLHSQIDGVKLMRITNRILQQLLAQCSIARAEFADVFTGLTLRFEPLEHPAVIAHDPVHLQKIRSTANGMRIAVGKSFEDFGGDKACHVRASLGRVNEQATFKSVLTRILCLGNHGPPVAYLASFSGLHLHSHSWAWHSSQMAVLYSMRAVKALASGVSL